jgi:hypothetical protein
MMNKRKGSCRHGTREEEEERRRWCWRRTQQLKYSGEPNQNFKKKKLSPTYRKKRCEHGTTYWGGKEELYTSRKIRKEQQQQLSSVEKERERSTQWRVVEVGSIPLH